LRLGLLWWLRWFSHEGDNDKLTLMMTTIMVKSLPIQQDLSSAKLFLIVKVWCRIIHSQQALKGETPGFLIHGLS